MNNRQVAHLWASGSKKSGKGSNFFFEGDIIYSYGHHFPIARRVNENFYLITERSYSVSTSRHISYTRAAIPGWAKVFPVPGSPRDSFASIKDAKMEQLRKMFSEVKAKTRAKTYQNARSLSLFIADSLELFSWMSKEEPLTWLMEAEEVEKIVKELERIKEETREAFESEEAKRAERQKAREEKRRKEWEERERIAKMELAELVPAWRSGEANETWKLRNLPPMLRIKGKKVQTSHGAEVELEEARKAFSFINAKLERGETWERNGETCQVGPFSLVKIDHAFVVVGCHSFPVEEVKAFGELLNK